LLVLTTHVKQKAGTKPMAAGSEQKAHHAVKAAKDKLLARRILIQGTGAQHA
jgi:hypothetical protein